QVGLSNTLVVEQLAAGAFKHDTAVLEHIGPVCTLEALLDILLHQKNRDAFAVDPLHDLEHLSHDDRRKPQARLVQYQKPRSSHHSAGYGYHLLLSPRERSRHTRRALV